MSSPEGVPRDMTFDLSDATLQQCGEVRCCMENCCMVITLLSLWLAGHDICDYTDALSSVLQVVHVEADSTMAISAWAMGSAGTTPHSAEVLDASFTSTGPPSSSSWHQILMLAVQ